MRTLWMAAAVTGVLTIACGGSEKAAPAAQTPKHDVPAAPSASSAVVQASTKGALAEFGVKECDDYLKKYTECVSSRVPEQVRAAMIAAVDQSRGQWKAAAATAEGRAGLAKSCTQALRAAKASLQSYGCSW